MKVTVCQIDPRESRIDRVLHELAEHIQVTGSEFLLLPELGLSEWLAADAEVDASRWLQSVADHERRIADFSQLNVNAIVGSRPIVNPIGSRRNQAFLWTRDAGLVAIREKYYLPDEDGYWEHRWYDRGEKTFPIARLGEVRLGVQICTDMWFFEWARHYAKSRVDLLCVPRVTPHNSLERWLVGGRAAAVCSGAFCLSSNLYYPKGDRANCGGMGWVVDPEGKVLATTDENEPFVTVDVDLEFSRHSKSTYPRYVPE